MQDWNVVVTVFEEADMRRAKDLLTEYGETDSSDFHNVLVMKAADVEAFADRFADRIKAQPAALQHISRVLPCQAQFDFRSIEDFEQKALEAVFGWANALRGSSFWVRVHRRGHKEQLSPSHEARFLEDAILRKIEALGDPGRVDFDNPDFVIDVETVGGRAGVSIWTREDRAWLPFLRIS
jgi:tRNA(Ser,Leu) C12 N-acetylase TAN1